MEAFKTIQSIILLSPRSSLEELNSVELIFTGVNPGVFDGGLEELDCVEFIFTGVNPGVNFVTSLGGLDELDSEAESGGSPI